MTNRTTPNKETREADRQAVEAEHGAPQTPTPEEEQAAERNTPSPEAAEHNKEMMERGAHQKGEGRIA